MSQKPGIAHSAATDAGLGGLRFAILAAIPAVVIAAWTLQEAMVSLEASVRYAGDVAIIDLAGRIVLNDGSAAVREAIAKLRETGANKILLNLADVSFIDSSGLGELASAYAGINKAGGQLKLVNLPVRIADLLRITKLDTVLIAFPSEPAALQSFNNGTVPA